MTDFTKTTNFTAKDALTTGDPNKIIKGSGFDTEFDNIVTASATKSNKIISGTTNGIIVQTAAGDLADGVQTIPSGTIVGTTDTQTLTNKTLTTAVIDSDLNTITNIVNADIKAAAAIDASKIGGGGVSTTEYDYLSGVTSDIQTQFDVESTNIFSVTGTVAASALTAGLNATKITFRSATLTDGVSVLRDAASAISVVVPSGATLGTVNAVQSKVVLIAIDNAGTVELAVINYTGGWLLNEDTLVSTTAIGVGSDSADVFYSTTARTSVAFRVVGYIESTQATAGTWATAPSTLQGDGDGNVSFSLLGNLAELDTVDSAQIDTDAVGNDELATLIGSSGTQTIVATGTWTPSAGFYNIVAVTGAGGTLGLEIFVSAAWRTPISSGINGLVWFDGTNMRIKEIEGTNGATLYYQKLA